MQNNYDKMEDTVRYMYGGVVWSHKVQEKQSDIYSRRFKWMETLTIVVGAITTTGILSLLFIDEFWIKILSALLSFITVLTGSFSKSFDLRSMTNNHKASANKLLSKRNELNLLLMKIKLGQNDIQDLTEQYEKLVNDINLIYQEAPNTTDTAVALARKALNINKDNTFSNEEINSYLPESLRREER